MNNNSISFVAKKSKELLNIQIESYRSLFIKSGIIIGVISIFLPIFLFLLEEAYFFIKILSIIPIGLLFWGILELLSILRSAEFYRGFNEDKFEKLINKELKEIEKFEIAANKLSIIENDKSLMKQQRKYNRDITLVGISLIISMSLLISDITLKTIYEDSNMTEKKKDKRQTENSDIKKEELPEVTKDDLKKLSEGVKKKKRDE